MYYRIPALARGRRARALFSLAVMACLASGCAGSGYPPGSGLSSQSAPVRADDTAAFNTCVAICSENTSLALVTRTGCLEGCEQARAAWPLRDTLFDDRRECFDSLLQQDVSRESPIAAMRNWCDAQWSHVHNRKGCYRAAEAYYANLGPASVCGGDAADTAAYAESLRKARENAEAMAPAQSGQAAPAAPAAPSAETLPSEAAALPLEYPVPDQKNPLPDATGAPAASVSPAQNDTPSATAGAQPAEPRVIRTTQPAGPLVPPPYIAPETAAPSGQTQLPSAAPAQEGSPIIQDTPKYQSRPAASQTGTIPAKPESGKSNQTGVTSASPAQPVRPVETAEPGKPGTAATQAGTAPPVSATPPITAAPQTETPAPSAPPSPQPAEQPATAQAIPDVPQTQLQPVTPSVDPTPSVSVPETVLPGQTPAEAAPPQTQLPVSPPQPSPLPVTPAPSPATEPTTTATPPLPGEPSRVSPVPEETRPPERMLPKPHLPMPPSENTGNAGTEPVRDAPPALMPPIPSTLDQRYDAPALIVPQLEVPPEGSSSGR